MKSFINYYKNSITPPYKISDVPVIALSTVLILFSLLTIILLSRYGTNSVNPSFALVPEAGFESENGSATGTVTSSDNSNASGGRLTVLGSAETGRCSGLEQPPVMDPNNTVTFTNVCPGDAGWPTNAQMQGKDVRIILPTDRTCKVKSNAIGGYDNNPAKNIWLTGGKLDYTDGASGSAGLTFAWWSGTVFIEGVEIDVNNSCNDAIRSYRAKGDSARIVVQNSYLRAPGYCTGGTHGDMLHVQGGEPSKGDTNVKELVMQNTRGDLVNQGIFVPFRTETVHGVRRMNLDRVELKLDSRYKWENNRISTMIYAYPYGSNTVDQPPPDGQSYKDVYLNWWDPWYPTTINRKDITVPPAASYDANNCAVFDPAVKERAKLTGTWCKGNPPGGFIVPVNKVGLSYNRDAFCSPDGDPTPTPFPSQ